MEVWVEVPRLADLGYPASQYGTTKSPPLPGSTPETAQLDTKEKKFMDVYVEVPRMADLDYTASRYKKAKSYPLNGSAITSSRTETGEKEFTEVYVEVPRLADLGYPTSSHGRAKSTLLVHSVLETPQYKTRKRAAFREFYVEPPPLSKLVRKATQREPNESLVTEHQPMCRPMALLSDTINQSVIAVGDLNRPSTANSAEFGGVVQPTAVSPSHEDVCPVRADEQEPLVELSGAEYVNLERVVEPIESTDTQGSVVSSSVIKRETVVEPGGTESVEVQGLVEPADPVDAQETLCPDCAIEQGPSVGTNEEPYPEVPANHEEVVQQPTLFGFWAAVKREMSVETEGGGNHEVSVNADRGDGLDVKIKDEEAFKVKVKREVARQLEEDIRKEIAVYLKQKAEEKATQEKAVKEEM